MPRGLALDQQKFKEVYDELPSPYEHMFLMSTYFTSNSDETADLRGEYFDRQRKVANLPNAHTNKTRPRSLHLTPEFEE